MEVREIEEVIQQCLPDAGCIVHPDANLFDELGLDSVAFIQLIVALEEAFGVAFRDEDLERQQFATPRAIFELVSQYKASIARDVSRD